MEKPKKILYRRTWPENEIYICPYCHRYIDTVGGGIQQCFICGGLVDTDFGEPAPDEIQVEFDCLQPWR